MKMRGPAALCAAWLFATLPLAGAQQEPWEDLLGQVGLTRQTAQLPADRWRGGGRDSLPDFERLWADWFQVRPTGEAWARQMLSSAGNLRAAVLWAAQRLDAPVATSALRMGLASSAGVGSGRERLCAALGAVQEAAGKPLDAAAREALSRQAQAVPEPIALAAATVLQACPFAVERRNAALAPVCSTPEQRQRLFDGALALAQGWDVSEETLQALEHVDLRALMTGGAALAGAADVARGLPGEGPWGEFTFRWDTPWGRVEITGDQDDVHPAGAYLLILDTGGRNVFHGGGGTGDAAHPVSVILSLAGGNRYETGGSLAFGAGVLGYGFLVDDGGEDTYSVDSLGLGSGVLGVGMVLDTGGHDDFRCVRQSEGAAVYGFGCVENLGGGNHYYCLERAQGMGGPKGVGVMLNLGGGDTYEAEDKSITNPSPQIAQHNVSLAQGAGFGRRAHPGDGRSLAGGIGLLVDGGANNHYSCGVFGQGVAYWYSVGMLVDCGGKSTYHGIWYVQGAAAHYAVGAMLDLGGENSYDVSIAQSVGHGHDYSIGLHCDYQGKDTYNFGGPVGHGNASGIGVFCNLGGGNKYNCGLLGQSTTGQRVGVPCLGLFMDLGGGSTFPASDNLARPGGKWARHDPQTAGGWGLGLSR